MTKSKKLARRLQIYCVKVGNIGIGKKIYTNYSILSSWKLAHLIREMLIFSVSITTQWNGKCAQYQGCENSHEAWHTEKNLQKTTTVNLLQIRIQHIIEDIGTQIYNDYARNNN